MTRPEKDLLAELVLLSSSIQRCHRAAVASGDTELAEVLKEIGWAAARLLANVARSERVKEAV